MDPRFGAFCLLLVKRQANHWQEKEITMTRFQFLLTDSLEKVLPWQAPEKMPEKTIKMTTLARLPRCSGWIVREMTLAG